MTKDGRRWPLVVLATTAVAFVLLGSVALAGGDSEEAPVPPTPSSSTLADPPASSTEPPAPVGVVAPPEDSVDSQTDDDEATSAGITDTDGPVEPLRVRIPGIEVDAPIIDLGLNPDGTLEVPSDFDDTGWYTGRSVPGELGPSVVVGHVDSTRGPAVFFRLRDLEVGDRIQIDRSDGLVAWFEVTETVLVDKDEFPTDDVYNATETPELRLITCGGGFDRSARSYLGNLIVYAEHIGNYEPPPTDGAT